MIKETAFIGCDNPPSVMAGRFDQPWNFIGEVKTDHRYFRCLCEKCNKREPVFVLQPMVNDFAPLVVVECEGYLFVTDDMIEVVVYFGVRNKCDSVYWARSGPPFRRARSCVNLSS